MDRRNFFKSLFLSPIAIYTAVKGYGKTELVSSQIPPYIWTDYRPIHVKFAQKGMGGAIKVNHDIDTLRYLHSDKAYEKYWKQLPLVKK